MVSSLFTRLGMVGLLLALAASPGMAQGGGAVAGTVTDPRLVPLDGVQVAVQGVPGVVRTDSRGRFRIGNLPTGRVTLQISRIGYRPMTQEVAVGETDLRVSLTEAAVSLSEIVVTGAPGGELKRAIGNSIATINTADLQKLAPAPAVTSLLNASISGVSVVPGTGTLGAGPRINIRGQGSFSLTDQPLVYIDGVRVTNDVASGPKSQGYGSGVISRLNDLNPDDIESMQVIKGPAAATLYGTEASNGVIQIITKRGAEGRPKYDFTTRQGAVWFGNPQGRIPGNYYRDTDGSIKILDLVAQQDGKGTPLYKNGNLQTYEGSMGGGSAAVR
ncbi:MAG: TonB-dependent receptor plug domain-containing protein, partial [Gemmatimonadetes bacterium]|nr:TonB-dependent receptor plug domain-containing protein [Gemmatimonadota bacterium]